MSAPPGDDDDDASLFPVDLQQYWRREADKASKAQIRQQVQAQKQVQRQHEREDKESAKQREGERQRRMSDSEDVNPTLLPDELESWTLDRQQEDREDRVQRDQQQRSVYQDALVHLKRRLALERARAWIEATADVREAQAARDAFARAEIQAQEVGLTRVPFLDILDDLKGVLTRNHAYEGRKASVAQAFEPIKRHLWDEFYRTTLLSVLEHTLGRGIVALAAASIRYTRASQRRRHRLLEVLWRLPEALETAEVVPGRPISARAFRWLCSVNSRAEYQIIAAEERELEHVPDEAEQSQEQVERFTSRQAADVDRVSVIRTQIQDTLQVDRRVPRKRRDKEEREPVLGEPYDFLSDAEQPDFVAQTAFSDDSEVEEEIE